MSQPRARLCFDASHTLCLICLTTSLLCLSFPSPPHPLTHLVQASRNYDGRWEEIARTEPCIGATDFNFANTIRLKYFESRQQDVRVEAFSCTLDPNSSVPAPLGGHADLIGAVECVLRDVMSAPALLFLEALKAADGTPSKTWLAVSRRRRRGAAHGL